MKCREAVLGVRIVFGADARKYADAPYTVGLPRGRRERLGGRRPAEQRDELAALHHSMTSSARASSAGGTVRPSALAVLRFTESSSLPACCTGRSAGFSPLRMRPV